LAAFGSGAGVMVENNTFVVNTALVSHDVLEVALLAGGVTDLVFSSIRLTTSAGLSICVRRTAPLVAFSTVVNIGSQQAISLAQQFGVNPDYVRIGADAIQVIALWKAARIHARSTQIPNAEELALTKTVAKQLNATDPRTGNLLRPFTTWRTVMQEVMNSGVPNPDPHVQTPFVSQLAALGCQAIVNDLGPRNTLGCHCL
jgi:hypothetical protein